MNTIKELYAYREMIFSLVRRDIKGRYKGSALGFLWTFINPLLQLGVYTMVFSVIMKNDIEKYYGGANCIWTQQNMVKKIYFPREVLPIAYVTSQFVNMLLSFLVVFVVLIVSGKGINPIALLCLPLIMVIEYLLALSMAMLSSAITVYLRDVEYILGIVTMAWQFLTPVMYSVDQVPEELLWVFNLNPMTPVIIAYRDILYYGKIPELNTLVHAAVFGIIVLIIGVIVFGKLKRRFAEEL